LQDLADRMVFGLAYIRTNARVQEQASLLDTAHEAILVKDLEDRITYWNKGAERTYGWSAAEALGKRSCDLLSTDLERHREALAEVLAQGEWNGEMIKKTKDGREIVIEVRWTLRFDEDGHPESILAINSDVTERKKLETQFLRAQRMESIGTLAGGIAHDLNNALAPIQMAISILEDHFTDERRNEP